MRLVTGKDITVLDSFMLTCGGYTIIVLLSFFAAAMSTLEGGPGTLVNFAIDHPILHITTFILGVIGSITATRKNF
ncbi:hypothetical protein ISR92_00490 [Patescibacteria group bacterium]|nr:hypothetical protein [Patescibacteria group bacterium]